MGASGEIMSLLEAFLAGMIVVGAVAWLQRRIDERKRRSRRSGATLPSGNWRAACTRSRVCTT